MAHDTLCEVWSQRPSRRSYERWIAAFANLLFQKAFLTPEELAREASQAAWAS
jgi:hypothetical protein